MEDNSTQVSLKVSSSAGNDGKLHDTEQQDDEKIYPPKKVVLPAMAAIYLAVFLVALDRTIIGTAVPSISNHFNSFGDIAWYESGFLLPLCALQLSFGLVYTYYPSKWVLIILVSIFEIGSIICASAPSSNALIVGRVVQGVGGAGIGSGAIILISKLVPLQARPQWTEALVLSCLVFFTPNSPSAIKAAPTWRGKLNQLDPLGFILVAPSVICLLFAIEWGGSKYPWNSGRIIALFVVFGVLLLAFIASQAWRGDKATLPPRILRQRSIISASLANVGVGSLLVLYAFYLPIWFQVIQGKSPQKSDLSLLPLLLSNVFAVISCGVSTSVVGYYTPFLIVGSALLIVGSALITTWSVSIGSGTWIGYQIITGLGLGAVLQGPNIAAQTVLSDADVSIGLSFLQFISFFAGSTFIMVSQTLLENSLVSGLKDILPNLDPSTISGGGASTVQNLVSSDQLPIVLRVYNDALRSVWYLGLGLACLVFVASWGFEWKSVKAKTQGGVNDKV
ncbi:MFS general substrate transporter, partial [Aureobasidium sp. EXF-3399]